ncbi:MAG: hypothetical protein GY835_07215 [bacterium]|nr:hypothetical protein [bacterium]
MRFRSLVVGGAVLLVAGGITALSLMNGEHTGNQVPAKHFMPTEHRLDSDAERLNRKGRKEWHKQMHRAAPDTDWKAVEHANGLTLQTLRDNLKRNSDSWEELGSRNLAGRIHCAAVSVDGDSLYAGSDLGGLWKADLNGNGWRPLADNLYGGVRNGVAVAGGDPEVITILSNTEIVRISDNMGETWRMPLGLPSNLSQAFRVVRDPADSDRVYLLTYAAGSWFQLYRSDNAGRSYTLIYSLGTTRGDFWVDRVDGDSLYLMVGDTLHYSPDHGGSWQEIGSLGAPTSPSKIILTASEAGDPTFYAAAQFSGQWELWRSTNGGVTWSHMYDINDFWETLNCSITNSNIVLFAGVENWRSANGGASFAKVNGWGEYYSDPLNKLHADNPGLECYWVPGIGEIFLPCTDGGIYRSTDHMMSVTNISMEGLGISQYYDIHTSSINPDHLLGGAQDQGYQQSLGPDGDGPWPFEQLISGDYGHLTSSDGTQNFVFSVYPGFTLLQQGETNPILRYLDFPTGASNLWLPPIVADPTDSHAYYFCGRYLHRGVWTGGNNVSYTQNPQSFALYGSSYLSAFAISPVDLDSRYAVTNTGELWYSHDGGDNWVHSPDQGPSSHYFYGNALACSAEDANTVWVGGSGYNGSAVYVSEDGGVSWEGRSEGLPNTLVYGLAVEDTGLGRVYAATESGPYAYNPLTGNWSYIGGNEVPLTLFWCVEWVSAIEKVRFGTYGRGIWEYTPDLVTAVGDETAPAVDLALSSYPNPFNPNTTICFNTSGLCDASIVLHDASGRRVRQLIDGPRTAGGHQVTWNGLDDSGRPCASGIYLARLEIIGEQRATDTIRLTLVR